MAVRSGFVGRSMLRNFGPLAVSFGLGGLDGELIFGPEDPLAGLQEGVGLDARIDVSSPEAPKTAIFFPDREGRITYGRLPADLRVYTGPNTSISYPEFMAKTVYYRGPVQAQGKKAPKAVVKGSKKNTPPKAERAPVKATRRRAPKAKATKKKKS